MWKESRSNCEPKGSNVGLLTHRIWPVLYPKKTKNALLIINKFNAWAHFVCFDLSSLGQDMVRVIKFLKNIEVVNTWKSYMRTSGWRIKWKNIIAVINATFAVAKRKAEKNSGLYGIRTLDVCDTGAALYGLPIEPISQLGAGRWIGSL